MSLRVIDAASYQGNMPQKNMDFDALIVKATEGCSYINPYCDSEAQEALSLGKKLGVYHFARNTVGNSAEAEADFFINQTNGYIKKAIPILDWEDRDTSDVEWALKWLQIVERAYGCKPMIYMSENVANRYNWSAVAKGNYGLWCAKYKDTIPDYNWDMAMAGERPTVKHWRTIALWQWTSVGRIDGYGGNLDCSIFYGDGNTWDKYVGIKENGGKVDAKPKTDQTYKYKVGDHVIFSTCYNSSSDLKNAAIPAADMLQNQGIITYIQEGARNPYLLNDGLYWVNDGDIRGYYNEI